MNEELTKLAGNIENVISENKDVKNKLTETQNAVAEIKEQLGSIDENFQNMQKEMIGNKAPKEMSQEEIKNEFGKALKASKNGQTVLNTMSTTVPADGGVLTSPDIENEVIRLINEQSVIRQLADVRTTTKGQVKVRVQTDGAKVTWVEETATRTTTDTPKYTEEVIDIFEMYAEPEVTNILLEDADMSVAEEVMYSVSEAFAEEEGTVFYTGDGNGKPTGLLVGTQNVVTKKKDMQLKKVNVVKTGVVGELGADISSLLVDAKKCIVSKYKVNAEWVMTSSTLAELEKLTDADGNPLITGSHEKGAPRVLKGFPVREDDYAPEIDNAEGLPFIVFGNFKKAYRIYDRRGMKTIVDNLTKQGFTKYPTSKRVGGKVVNAKAFVGIVAKA